MAKRGSRNAEPPQLLKTQAAPFAVREQIISRVIFICIELRKRHYNFNKLPYSLFDLRVNYSSIWTLYSRISVTFSLLIHHAPNPYSADPAQVVPSARLIYAGRIAYWSGESLHNTGKYSASPPCNYSRSYNIIAEM